MSDNESSDLSDIPSDQEPDLQLGKKDGILKFFSKVSPKAVSKEDSPPRKKRDASPPHEYVLADNADIAVSLRPSCRVLSQRSRRKRVADSPNRADSS